MVLSTVISVAGYHLWVTFSSRHACYRAEYIPAALPDEEICSHSPHVTETTEIQKYCEVINHISTFQCVIWLRSTRLTHLLMVLE